MRLDGARHDGPFEEIFDYVIVGSGAAGASAARVLADTGASIAVLEEGPAVDPKDFHDRAFDAFKTLFRDGNAQVARGRAFIPVIQGRCLGGSTVVNSAIVWRLPEDVWRPWDEVHRLGDAIPLKDLHRHWDLIEKELGIAETPQAVWGELNALMRDGARKLGAAASPTRRNTPSCRGSGRCLTGCPNGAKQSMLVSYLPYAEQRGATLVTGAKVHKVELAGDRAVAVRGRLESGEPFRVRARKAVLVAASAIQTPGILARSGVESFHLGENFQGHPGCPVTGVFDRDVAWRGATQGYDADELRVSGRVKIETIGLPPEIMFARMGGAGSAWLDRLAETRRMAVFAVQMRAWARGSVRDRFFGTDIVFDPDARDMVNMRRGIRFAAELLFAAGAREVLPGIHGLPERIGRDELPLLESASADPRRYSWIVSHLFGTARMSRAASEGVVGADFAVHGTRNLLVVDSSVFPTNTGVNPQHAIMGVAMLAAERLAARRDL